MRFAGKNRSETLTVSEVSDFLRIHPTTLYRLLRRHSLPAFKIGKDWRFTAEDINRWLKEMEDRGSATTLAEAKLTDNASLKDITNTTRRRPKSHN
jgi:excisionase family DNA binding protein